MLKRDKKSSREEISMAVGNTLRIAAVAGLLLGGITGGAQGFIPGGAGGVVGGEVRGMVVIKGKVVCAACSVEEARKGQPNTRELVELRRQEERIVLRIHAVNGSSLWDAPLSVRWSVRAQDGIFRQLTAEENHQKEVEITGILRNTQVLDIATVTISG
jgi:tRNA threonylcarbamoyladenosine modification (KEOPS) complex  Pcc1 subunit